MDTNVKFVHQDLVDSLTVVSSYFYAWLKINILLELFDTLKDTSMKSASIYTRSDFENYDKGKYKRPINDDEPTILRRSCVARIICLSNQEAAYLKNPTAKIVAETLR